MTSDATPSIWMIGDLQGCCDPLHSLLRHPDIAADPNARFWFAGDLINRGPQSVDTLRMVMQLGDRAVSVLGNHDLHFLAVAAKAKKPGKSDTFGELLSAPDAADFIDWMRQRPLMHREYGHVVAHAGILPAWTIDQAQALSDEVSMRLRGPDWQAAMHEMYGNEPRRWKSELQGAKRLRFIVNAFTRMRMCARDGSLDFDHKGAPTRSPDLLPWFEVPKRKATDHTIVFGHWSTLGLMLRPDVVCLDTGCVWGRKLTALRLHDRKLVQIDCKQYQRPKNA